MKQTFTLPLRALMCVMALVATSALAQVADPVSIGGIFYTLDDNTREATVVENPDGYTGDVVVPGVVDHNNWTYTVTAVGADAFSYSGASTVDLPATLRRIGDDAFTRFGGQSIIIRSLNLGTCTGPWFNKALDKFNIYMEPSYRTSNTSGFTYWHLGNRIKWHDLSEAPAAEKYFRILGHDVVPNTPDLLGDGTGRISVDADGIVCIRNLNNLDCGGEYFIDTNTENYIFVNGKNSINCTRGIRSLKSIYFMKKDGVTTGAIDMTLNTPGATAISMHHEAKSTFLSLYDVDLCVRFTPAAANPRNTGVHLSDGRIKGIGSALSSRLVIETQGGLAISRTSELPRPGSGAQYGANYELDATGSLAGNFVIDNYDPMRGALTTRKMWVSEDKQVYLSQGILMYNYNTYHARFADSQLDAYGSDPVNGYMTMFGWSTTGSNYGQSEYRYSQTGYDYYSGDFVDWGTLIGDGWRSLSAEEFVNMMDYTHLIDDDFDWPLTGVKVCKEDGTPVWGTIIMPKTWKSFSDNDRTRFENPTTHDYFYHGGVYNDIPLIANVLWQQMEKDGAFFLPAAGTWGSGHHEGLGYDPFDVAETHSGHYWTSTPNPIILDCNGIFTKNPVLYKHSHCLVRLVRDVPAEEMDEKPDWDALRKKYSEWLKEHNEDGINDVKSAAPAAPTKVLRDGQILIIRDGNTYNTLGVRVK